MACRAPQENKHADELRKNADKSWQSLSPMCANHWRDEKRKWWKWVAQCRWMAIGVSLALSLVSTRSPEQSRAAWGWFESGQFPSSSRSRVAPLRATRILALDPCQPACQAWAVW